MGFTLCNDRNVSQDDEMMVIEALAAVVVIRYLVCKLILALAPDRSSDKARRKPSAACDFLFSNQ